MKLSCFIQRIGEEPHRIELTLSTWCPFLRHQHSTRAFVCEGYSDERAQICKVCMIMAADIMSLNNLPSVTGSLLLHQGVTEKRNTLGTENAGDATDPALHQE